MPQLRFEKGKNANLIFKALRTTTSTSRRIAIALKLNEKLKRKSLKRETTQIKH